MITPVFFYYYPFVFKTCGKMQTINPKIAEMIATVTGLYANEVTAEPM